MRVDQVLSFDQSLKKGILSTGVECVAQTACGSWGP